ncbi:DUF1648 domain-containing protein [Kyrpidia sp.]|uniref:DUF1648 domain-containing protein n=1 Tax=Kyrpidia sp. TaxID=2073077 RepID=UPI00338DA7BD|nr:DUF1648 domain-containing protein [Kyrpidia sp.]
MLRLPYRWWDYAVLAIGAGIAVIELVYTIVYWSHLPSKVPTHFGVFGTPDAWGSRDHVFVLPIVTIVMYVGTLFLTRIPHYFNYPTAVTSENAPAVYALGRLLVEIITGMELPILLFVLQRGMIRAALGVQTGLGSFLILVVALLGVITIVAFIPMFLRAGRGR